MSQLIVKSRVKEQLDDYQASAEFYDALNTEVAELIAAAASRAKANDRKTVMPHDV